MWEEKYIVQLVKETCDERNLGKPVLLRFSQAAVFSIEDNVLLRVDQRGRNVWGGPQLAVLSRYFWEQGLPTPHPLDEAVFTKEKYDFSFYQFIKDENGKNGQSGDFLRVQQLGEILASLHLSSDPDVVEGMANGEPRVDYPSLLLERTVREAEFFMKNFFAFDPPVATRFMSQLEVLCSNLTSSYEEKVGRDAFFDSNVVVHGDAHLGNVISNNQKLFLIDFEHVGIGPKFLDHLHILLADRVYEQYKGKGLYSTFASGYGESFVGLSNLSDWLKVVAVPYILWTARVGLRSRAHQREAELRTSWFLNENNCDKSPEIFWTEGF